jgi:hypothetical protein
MNAEDIEKAISEAFDKMLPRIIKEQKKDEKMNNIENPEKKSKRQIEPVSLFGRKRGRRI